MKFAIVIEKADGNYSAYAPDLPGCIATGPDLDDIRQRMQDAIAFHLEGMQDEGLEIPDPTTEVDYVELPEYVIK